ncbi:MAG: DNA-formamidopyrimidine glycosylase [Micavibrio aeruginosavorus]|uniref:Formamidopyrimidine-DNA glycosylase n=1 Tax=Micavibrio aeruginosavorus TaxID=349221 RepID=A0A2W5FUD6_9BACT|nr:MAG: DNA-formamidopyrimidine glycosylase [Micavibrio aeruginosavorus]
MPELPEVETVVTELNAVTKGAKITSSETLTQKIRIPVPPELDLSLKNKVILHVTRRAKYILIHLDGDKILVIHLGMSGRIHIHEADKKTATQKHDHLILHLSNGKDVFFNDPRRFGLIELIDEEKINSHRLFSHLGPEPLSRNFSPSFLAGALKSRKGPVKVALMDQCLVVGVGNIYASEALFEAGIHPETSAQKLTIQKIEKLTAAIKAVLKSAIKAGGSTLKDYRKTNGDLGYFQHKFAVYDRAGKACRGCVCDIAKTGGVQKITQGGRSTFYCPRKQL